LRAVTSYRLIIDSFVEMVRTGDHKQIRSDYADALKTLALTQAVVSGARITMG
jgi:hypothetical protein